MFDYQSPIMLWLHKTLYSVNYSWKLVKVLNITVTVNSLKFYLLEWMSKNSNCDTLQVH